ncbi:MAG: methyl-accepting chemotaxis protein [Acidimicrobiales bacterium]
MSPFAVDELDTTLFEGARRTSSGGSEPAEDLLGRAGIARAVLEALPTNVLIANAQLDLVYLNPHAARTMHALGRAVQTAFGVREGQILGGSIHRFHKHPARVEGILRSRESLPHEAELDFGEVTLHAAINEVRDASDELVCYVVVLEDVAAKRAAEARAGELAQRVHDFEQVNGTIQTIAAATEQMLASGAEIARSAGQATSTAKEAVRAAAETEATVSSLGEASAQIGSVVKLITEIASQTNLLALNAAIEAARAGDAGRGFAVVASEVKALARGTAEATGKIGNIVEEIKRNTASAVGAIASISSVIGRIDEMQGTIAAAVEEQSAVTGEISRNLAEVSSRVEEIVRVAAASAS